MKKLIYIFLILFAFKLFGETFDIHEVIEIGLENSYDLNSQKYSLRVAKQNLYSSYLDFLPSASYNISKIETDNSSEKSGSVSISESVSSNESRYFSIKNNLSSLRKNEINLEIAKRDLVYTVVQYYLKILENKEEFEVAKLEVEISRKNLEETKILFSHGKVSEINKKQVEINLSRAKIDSNKAKNELERSVLNLCFLINLNYNENYEFAKFDYEFRNPNDFSYSQKNDLEISSAKEDFLQSKLDYTQNKLDFLPTLSFSVSKDLAWKEKSIFDFDKNSSQLQYTLSLSYPLFSPLTNLPKNLSSKYAFKQSKLTFDNIKKDQKQNFELLLSDFRQSKESLKLAKMQLDLEELNFNLVNEKYKLGKANFIEFEDAKKNLLKSKTDKISEYYNLILIQEKLNLICNSKILKKY